MVRIEPCATTVRSGHVVVRKKRRSSMARLKEAACSTSFCFFLPLLLLLLFCETLSSTGLKRQREREKEERNLLSDHLPPRFSLFETTFEKVELAWREKKQVETLLLLFFFSFSFFYVTIQAAKRLVNELATAIIIINRRILRVEIFAGIYTRRWMWVVVDGWPRVEGNLIFYLIGRMEEFIYPRGPFVGRQPFPFVIL